MCFNCQPSSLLFISPALIQLFVCHLCLDILKSRTLRICAKRFHRQLVSVDCCVEGLMICSASVVPQAVNGDDDAAVDDGGQIKEPLLTCDGPQTPRRSEVPSLSYPTGGPTSSLSALTGGENQPNVTVCLIICLHSAAILPISCVN